MEMQLPRAYASSRALSDRLERFMADVFLMHFTQNPEKSSGFALIRALRARAIRCYPGGVTVTAIALPFGASIKTISSQ